MKKTLAVFVFVLLAACLIAPKFVAPKYQEQVSQIVTKLNLAPGYKASLDKLEETWFTSKSVLHLSYDLSMIDPNLYGQKIEADVVLDTHFGPLLISDVGLVGWYTTKAHYAGDPLRDKLHWAADKAFFEASIVMDLLGNISTQNQIPEFDLENGLLTFSGYQGEGTLGSNGVLYDGKVDLIKLDSPQQQVSLSNSQINISIEDSLTTLASGGLYNGNISVGFDDLTIGPDVNISGTKLLITSILNADTQLGEVITDYSIDHFSSPELMVDDLSFVLEMKHLSNQFFLDYKTFSESMLTDTNNPEEIYLQLFSFLTDNMGELLVHNPEMNVTDFSGRLTEGEFSATLHSRLKEMDAPSLEQLLDPQFWLWNMIVDTKIQADDTLVTHLGERFLATQMRTTTDSPQLKQQVQMMIGNFVQQGFIKRDNDKLMTEINIANGQGKIYDFPFPLTQ